MPDWSYHPIFKGTLLKLPGHFSRELIHKSMSSIASIPGGRKFIHFLGHMETSPEIRVNTSELTFSSPIGLSGKVDPYLTGTKAFANLGFSFIEIGPVTMEHNQSMRNPLYDSEKDQVIFPSEEVTVGLAQTLRKVKKYSHLPLHKIIRIKGTENELVELATSLKPFGDIFVLEYQTSISSELVSLIKKQLYDKPVFFAITTNQISNSFSAFVEMFNKNEFDGLLLDGDRAKESFEDLSSALKKVRTEISERIPIITSGGIREPKDALSLLENGATLLLLSSGYVTSGPGLPKRINELLYFQERDSEVTISSGWIFYWLFGLCILIGGILALLFSMTRVILPYDEAFLSLTRAELLDFNKNVLFFMAHDRMTLSGTMISGGILYMQLAKHGIKYGVHWCRKAVNIAGILGFLGILMFIGYGYFDWLHGLFWLVLLQLFIAGYLKTKNVVDTPMSYNDSNHIAWKLSLYGQLAFIILGFSFVIGGIIISYIGTTTVFVKTDIGYLCMPPEMIEQFNNKLISVIAHDRAGFGSALLSVGLLVLMISLWGFREGEKWVWWSMLVGGLPAFLAGIITHFVIGYTTFIHLLPAYITCVLYVMGLLLSFPFLMRRNC
ncbi:dihydroorotate dehydrogenase [Metabacillus bambusae]|uniref:Dihydroorotate dehydrogenase n=1 Tax=Metabacillus bambusae TaxID=2795218 RepID=A0ABS3N4Z7_9BACI|nr:dihydroorotate dehydrogenase [Metabacillus bambusae]MBO1513215.1 dihydroorotate dehydrogenase [Metabacillus bambusae]